MRASRLLTALGVVLIGLCAACPFRDSSPRPSHAERAATLRESAPLALPLRQTDAPLALAPSVEISPAMNLTADTIPELPAVLSPVNAIAATVVPPPAMPISFQPIATDFRPTNWRPAAPVEENRPPPKPRLYRLRDGDTLPRLAERMLGDAARSEEIYAANRHVLTRPDLLPVGVEIVLPPRQGDSELVPVSR